MIITISEFAEQRGIDRDTINAWIRNHPEVADSCDMRGKDKIIDNSSEAYHILEKKYPLPRPIQIIEDTESRLKLIKSQELIIQLQTKMAELQAKVADDSRLIAAAEATKALLEDKEQQLLRERDLAEKERARADELQKALDAERSKTWFQKLLGK